MWIRTLLIDAVGVVTARFQNGEHIRQRAQSEACARSTH
jgi:hypothetical protein